jgi:hypothetical protein
MDYLAIQEADEAVGQGVQLLDDVIPEWRQHVNVDTLNMASVNFCVLGQIAGALGMGGPGGYRKMTQRLGLDIDSEITHGFETGVHTDWTLEVLQAFWIERIRDGAPGGHV